MKVWISRDKRPTKQDRYVCVWDSKPKLNGHGWFECGSENPRVVLDDGEAKYLLGFTLRKGSCKQYELTLTEI